MKPLIEGKYEYFAFISYKREEEKWAKWLQHKLEHYKLPFNHRKTDLPKEIRPVFKDNTELNPGNLPDQINTALAKSKYLIVICSPLSAKSEWVNKEVEAFISQGRVNQIIPFIVEGSVSPHTPDTQCFPPALLALPPEQEILGANINEIGRDAAVIKVISKMFDLKYDSLWRRYEREKRRKRLGVLAIILLISIITIGFAVFIAGKNRMIETERNRVEKANYLLKAANDSILNQNSIIVNQADELKRVNDELVVANDDLKEERDRVVKANKEMLKNRAHFLSKEAEQLISMGDTYKAIALLLNLFPSKTHPETPYVAECERVLRIAVDSLERGGYNPIAVLDYQQDRTTYYERISNISIDDKDKRVWIQYSVSGDASDVICSYSLLTGQELDHYYSSPYERLFNNESEDGDVFFSADKEFMICVQKKQAVLYRYNNGYESTSFKIKSSDLYVTENTFSAHEPIMVVGDSLYNYLTGGAIRSIGLNGYYHSNATFSSDSQFVIVKNDKFNDNGSRDCLETVFSVEKTNDGDIVAILDSKRAGLDLCDSNMLMMDNNILRVDVYNSDDYYYQYYKLPTLKHLYSGQDYNRFGEKDSRMVDIDSENNTIRIKDRKSGVLLKTITVDLSIISDQPYYAGISPTFLRGGDYLLLEGMMAEMVYDLKNNIVIRNSQTVPDRYSGSRLNRNGTARLLFTMNGDIMVADPVWGEPFLSTIAEFDSATVSYYHAYDCSFTNDERHILYFAETQDEDGFQDGYQVTVIRWSSLDELLERARDLIHGRTLSDTEKTLLYL